MQKVTKAIIAAAGLGTRFLPQTKAMPKEMLPIVDKPVIQIIVEQLVAAGVTDIIMVTGSTKRPIEDHFDRSDDLEQELREKGKDDFADQIRDIANLANFVYIRQKGAPKGTSLPVLNARHLLQENEPFFVVFADDFFRSEVPEPVQMLEVYQRTGGAVGSFANVARADVKRYGVADVVEQFDEKTFRLKGMVEKPDPDTAPSTYVLTGCCLLTPAILPILEKQQPGVGGEVVLTEAINELAKHSPVYGRVIDGTWHDAGDKSRYLQAIVDYALINPDLGPDFRAYLEKRLAEPDDTQDVIK